MNHFITKTNYSSAISLELDHVLDLVLSIDIYLRPNSSLSVTLQNRETQRLYSIFYIVADTMISVQDYNIYYGIGLNSSSSWKRLTRDLFVDLQKGLPQYITNPDDKRRKMRRTELKVVEVSLLGIGIFDNLTLSTSEHIFHFYDSAEWFVRHQNPNTGGWEIPVKRKLGNGFAELQRGWYSGMAQGHAISLLARAYYHSSGKENLIFVVFLFLNDNIFSRRSEVFKGCFRWTETVSYSFISRWCFGDVFG